jgi:hypothetical protein
MQVREAGVAGEAAANALRGEVDRLVMSNGVLVGLLAEAQV